MTNLPELFGSLVYNQQVMSQTLSSSVYKALKHTMEDGTPLDLDSAKQIAESMKKMGNLKRRNTLLSLVPAPYRHHSRKA